MPESITKGNKQIHPMTIYVDLKEYEKARRYQFENHKRFKNIKKLIEFLVHQEIRKLKLNKDGKEKN